MGQSGATDSASPPRLLALVDASFEEEEVGQVLSSLSTTWHQVMGAAAFFKDSRTWYSESFSLCGSWDAWTWATVAEKPYGSRRTHFDGFVVCTPTLGRANKAIVDHALRDGRVVLFWDREQLSLVQRLITRDENNWRAGWAVQTVPILGRTS